MNISVSPLNILYFWYRVYFFFITSLGLCYRNPNYMLYLFKNHFYCKIGVDSTHMNSVFCVLVFKAVFTSVLSCEVNVVLNLCYRNPKHKRSDQFKNMVVAFDIFKGTVLLNYWLLMYIFKQGSHFHLILFILTENYSGCHILQCIWG